jgi:hypothetical protein
MHRDKTGRRATIISLTVMEEPDDIGPHMRNHHHTIAIALGTMAEPDNPDHITRNHRGITTVPDTEAEVDDPGHHSEHMITPAKETPEI